MFERGGENMRNLVLSGVLSLGMLFGTAMPAAAMVRHRTYYSSRARYLRHRRHVRTARRVAIGAAGGAAIGAVAGGAKGGVIGGIAGAGAGAIYDAHKRHRGH